MNKYLIIIIINKKKKCFFLTYIISLTYNNIYSDILSIILWKYHNDDNI